MQLSTAIPMVMAAIVIVIMSNGIFIQPINPRIIVAAKIFGIIPIIATDTDLNNMIRVTKIPSMTVPKVKI